MEFKIHKLHHNINPEGDNAIYFVFKEAEI